MSYEYIVQQVIIPTEDFLGGALPEWLNTLGADNWRVVQLKDGPVKGEDSIMFMGVFERKIETNQKLRNMQLGKETDDNDGKKAEAERD
jgi:hypothetical protein